MRVNRLCAFQIVNTLFTITAEASTVHLVPSSTVAFAFLVKVNILHPAPQVEFADVHSTQSLLDDRTIRLSCNIAVT